MYQKTFFKNQLTFSENQSYYLRKERFLLYAGKEQNSHTIGRYL